MAGPTSSESAPRVKPCSRASSVLLEVVGDVGPSTAAGVEVTLASEWKRDVIPEHLVPSTSSPISALLASKLISGPGADHAVAMMLYGIVIPCRTVWDRANALLVDNGGKYTFPLGPIPEDQPPREYYRSAGAKALGADWGGRKDPVHWDDSRPAREWLVYKVPGCLPAVALPPPPPPPPSS